MARLRRSFSAHDAGAILACDIFIVDTPLLRTLYVLVFLEISSRRTLYANCTAHPQRRLGHSTGQKPELGAEPTRGSDPARDPGAFAAEHLIKLVDVRGIPIVDGVLTPYRRPRANTHCERMIKTLRNEAVDWLLIFGERHLHLVLEQ